MIRPKIPLVQNGQRLTSDLVNSMIHRTEYAADLLRQYRLTAGTEMYVEPHYDGTRVSYLQPVGGGQILPAPSTQYRIVGQSSNGPFILDTFNNKIDFLLPKYNPIGIQGNLISGTFQTNLFPLPLENRGFFYDGITYTTFNNPLATSSSGDGTYGIKIRNSIICGYYQGASNDIFGYFYNKNTQSFSSLNYPSPYTDTYINGLYDNGYSCGNSFGPSIEAAWIHDGSQFKNINNGQTLFLEPCAISSKYAVGYANVTDFSTSSGFIYNIDSSDFIFRDYPGASNTVFFDIFMDKIIVGFATPVNGGTRGFIYSIESDEFSLLESPDGTTIISNPRGIG